MCIVCGDFSSYVYLMGQLLMKSLHDKEETYPDNEVKGFNSAISPCKQRTPLNNKKTYPLGQKARWALRACTANELQEVLRFFCLNLGCQHACGKAYLLSGMLDAHDVVIKDTCNDSCSICTKKWNNQFILVYCSAVMSFLEHLMLTGRIPQEIDYKLPILLLLAGSPFCKEAIFDRVAGSVSWLQVNASFLSLTAAVIIHLQPKSDSLQCAIKQQVYTNGYWQPIIQDGHGMAVYYFVQWNLCAKTKSGQHVVRN